MGIHYNTRTVRNGLVFHYDMGNPGKSWKGKPVVNEWNTGIVDSYGGTNAKTVLSGEKDALGRYTTVTRKTGKIRFGNTSGTDIGTLYPGNTYTFSFYARRAPGFTSAAVGELDVVDRATTRWVDGSVMSGTVASNLTNEWRRFSVTATHNNSTSYRFIDFGSYNDTGFVYDWCLPQIEQNTFPTPYVNGTRTDTQAIIDISGQGNTITPANLSYNSDGTFEFDAVDDYLDLGSDILFKSGGGWTVESWVNYSSVAAGYNNTTSPANFIGSATIAHNSWYWSVFDSKLALWNRSPGIWKYGSTTIQPNTWYNAVLTCADSGTSYQMYLNGVPEGGNHTTYSWNAAYSSLLVRYIGQGNSSYPRRVNGRIASTKIYNRALTDNEVRLNFEATRRRYDI